jgi:hypothetical protein
VIEPIHWPQPRHPEMTSPFERGEHERPLRITFHTSTLGEASAPERVALEALHELCGLDEIEALQTGEGLFPRIEITPAEENSIPVAVIKKDGSGRVTAIHQHPHRLRMAAARLLGQSNVTRSDMMAMYQDLLVVKGHQALRQDILVTLSSRLLPRRTLPLLCQANLRTPAEAAEIVGLFLRSRDNYIYQYASGCKSYLNRGLFYSYLARLKLPRTWRYCEVCVEAEKVRKDEIATLAVSILIRCIRALQAKDAIGVQFYVPQHNDTRDAIMYHFDYLTLLLAGAFDATARIASRVYEIKRPREEYSGYRNATFRNSLAQVLRNQSQF